VVGIITSVASKQMRAASTRLALVVSRAFTGTLEQKRDFHNLCLTAWISD